MSKNITLLGASYPDVPAVQLPQTGGGTATFTDTSDANAVSSDLAEGKTAYVNGTKITGTASGGGGGAISVVDTQDSAGGTIRTITAVDISDTTAQASDVATGKVFYTAEGTQTTGTSSGSGGVDAPTFTITLDGTSTTTIVCDKTYGECLNYINDGVQYAVIKEVNTYYDEEYTYTVNSRSASNDLIYGIIFDAFGSFDIVYHSNGTIDYVEPSSGVTTLEATANGTYEDSQGRLYYEVAVQVPGPEGTKNITTNGYHDVADYAEAYVNVPSSSPTLITKTITANGTYNASSDSADGYSSVTVNVSGGGISGVVKGTFSNPTTVSTSTNVIITTTADIGFTPTKFLMVKNSPAVTDKYINVEAYADVGGYYVRMRSVYSGQSSAFTNSTVGMAWNTQSTGYLNLTSGNVRVNTSSSYILGEGDYTWIAIE